MAFITNFLSSRAMMRAQDHRHAPTFPAVRLTIASPAL
jgi:hypothetical protein